MRSIALLLLSISLFAGCGEKVPTHFDIEIGKFKIPEGWVANEGENDTAVVLTRDEETESISAIISVDVLTAPPNSTFVEAASAYAKRYQGTIQAEGETVDSEKAIYVKMEKGNTLAPTDCVVVLHKGKVCFINGGSIGATAIKPVLDKMIETWKWAEE
jgi:hypothetical protein